jgi:hypothetical protein
MIDGSAKGQRINTTSSTEAEVVGVHENMPSILWMRYFLEAQGYPLKLTKVHQDNLSGKQLETNKRASSSKRTRHMNIRYFFVADVQKRQHITIDYCPTDEMIGDFFTKPVGGSKFRRFRNIIMNISHDEHGPVDVDELMIIHNEKMLKRFDMVLEGSILDSYRTDEHHISKEHKTSADVSSQECVEDMFKISNIMWAGTRYAHKQAKDNRPINRGRAHRRTYAEVATPASE